MLNSFIGSSNVQCKIRIALAGAIGLIVSSVLLCESGLVGLHHDWAIPPFDGQIVANVQDMLDGWRHSGMGSPIVYPAEYPIQFLLGFLAWIGVPPDIMSKALVFGAPALAFIGMSLFAERLGLKVPASFVAGGFYALSPVLFNKLASGQLAYVFSYAVLPFVFLACDRMLARRRFRDTFVLAMTLVLAASQIQVGLIAVALAILYAFTIADIPAIERAYKMGVALLLFAAAESPVLVGVLMQGRQLGNEVQFTPNAAWLDVNSIHIQDAVRLLGYVSNYFDLSTAEFGFAWQSVSWAVVLFAGIGMVAMPRRVRLWCGLSYVVALIAVSGSKGLFAPLVRWFFLHCSMAQVFRELYHLMVIPAVVYSLALGYCFARFAASTRHAKLLAAALLLIVLAYVSPMLSGNLDGWVKAFPIAQDLRTAYDRFGDSPYRVAWFPMEGPLAFEGSGMGIDPMAVTPAGSLWQYNLEWPLTAVDMDIRSARREASASALRALGVGTAVFRRHFASELPEFEYYMPNLWHFWRMGGFINLPIGEKVLDDQSVVAYTLAHPLPFAFAADDIAYVPARLDVAAKVLAVGSVPISYGTRLPLDVNYVLFTDQGDVAAEATDGYPELDVDGFQAFDARLGFAPMQVWYWYRPAYADARNGLLTIGAHECRMLIARNMKSAVVVVGWIATPMGGRVRVGVGRTTREFSTYAPFTMWRSQAISLGEVKRDQEVRVEALDDDGEVALRTVRVLSGDDFQSALQRFAALRASARSVFSTVAFSSFRRIAYGQDLRLPAMDAERNYRLSVRACMPAPGRITIVDENEYIIAQSQHGAGCFEKSMGFDGAPGVWKIDLAFERRMALDGARWDVAPPIIQAFSWSLEERRYQAVPVTTQDQYAALEAASTAVGSGFPQIVALPEASSDTNPLTLSMDPSASGDQPDKEIPQVGAEQARAPFIVRDVAPGAITENGEITYPIGHRVFVLNERFNDFWVNDGGEVQHVPTVLGTNAWIAPQRLTRSASVRYTLSQVFHIAYAIGAGVITLGFFALF